MKTTLLLAAAMLACASTAIAQDAPAAPAPELLCLDDLEVGPALDIAHDVAPRARIRAHHDTNCLVVIAHADRVATLRSLLALMEERARVWRRASASR